MITPIPGLVSENPQIIRIQIFTRAKTKTKITFPTVPPKQTTWPHRKVEAAILKTSGDQLVSSQLQTNYWVCVHKYENKTGDQLFISQCLANSCVPVCTISTNLDTTVTKNCRTV